MLIFQLENAVTLWKLFAGLDGREPTQPKVIMRSETFERDGVLRQAAILGAKSSEASRMARIDFGAASHLSSV
jgi:hypothetical protein